MNGFRQLKGSISVVAILITSPCVFTMSCSRPAPTLSAEEIQRQASRIVVPPEIDETALEQAVLAAPDLEDVVNVLDEWLGGGIPQVREKVAEAILRPLPDGVSPEQHRRLVMSLALHTREAFYNYDTAGEHFGAALGLEKRGMSIDAYYQYQRAVKKDGTHAMSQAGLARTALKRGFFVEAIDAYERAIEMSPESVGWIVALGETLYTAGRTDEAFELYQCAAERDPEWPLPHEKMAIVYWKRGELDTAWETLKKSIDMGGEPDFMFYHALRNALGLPDDGYQEKGWTDLPAPGVPQVSGQYTLQGAGPNLSGLDDVHENELAQ